MIPYKFDNSDSLFNLGSALAFVQMLPHGVYIVMNGRYFNWNKAIKIENLENLKDYPLLKINIGNFYNLLELLKYR